MHKNVQIRQEGQETRRGDISHINTTNTMEMYNSTIMKIVVTQKRTNVNSPGGAASETRGRNAQHRDSHNFPSVGGGAGRSPRNAMFGSSVLVNGVAMKSSNGSVVGSANPNSNQQGIIRVGRGVGTTGKNV